MREDFIARWRDLYLHHFTRAELETLQSRLGHLSVCKEDPGIVEVPDGIIPKPEAPQRTLGVFDRDGHLVEASLNADRHPVRGRGAARGGQRDRRTAFYLGVGEWQYGHFLLETLSRAWAWNDQFDELVPVVQIGMPDFGRALYGLIPGLTERIAPLERSVQFRRVVVPRAAFVIGHRAHLRFKNMCMQMAERALGKRQAASGQPLYISRTRLDPANRHALLGEQRLERFFESEGFAVAHPERLPIDEQIALFNRHKWLVAPLGSACHTRLFALSETNFVMFAHPGFLRNYVLCDALSQGATHYLNVLSIPDLGVNLEQNFWQPFMLNEERLLASLKYLGLVKPAATIGGASPGLDEYRMKWIEVAREQVTRKPNLAEKLHPAMEQVASSIGKGVAAARLEV